MKTVIISGYYNPIHVGHLDYIDAAAKLGDNLIVIVNNDAQVALKGSVPFMCEKDRLRVVNSIKGVDKAIISIDKDKTVCETLRMCFKDEWVADEVIFANGGDATIKIVPETSVCDELGIKMIFGVGGDKVESSSNLIRRSSA